VTVVANALVLLVALLHLWFLVLEMFLWTHPLGLSVFSLTLERAQATAGLAANQGLYNGFLAAGLIWGLLHPEPAFGWQLKLFFLACIIVAALYGGYRVGRRVFYWQGVPALVAVALLLIA
jgi:putative membrane protein